jgi:very-short-patch-repair endonuclease
MRVCNAVRRLQGINAGRPPTPSSYVGGGLGWRTKSRRKCLLRGNSAKDERWRTNQHSRGRARTLRANLTEAEHKLWSRLRKKQLSGFQFRRQYSIGPFFVDFICLEASLIIEVDGSQHADQQEQDESRSEFLRDNGYTVLRFWNFGVMRQIDDVVRRIFDVLERTERKIETTR